MGQSSSHLSLPTTVPFLRNRQKPRMFVELDFTNELPLKLYKGTIKFDKHDGKGEQVQYGGRTPSQEREHLDQIEKEALAKALAAKKLDPKTTDYPRHNSEPETAKLLADIIANDIRLWDGFAMKANPAVSKGFPGASDIHIASMPGADTAVYNNVAFACLEEGISFGIVYEANWEELWFYVWKSRQIKAKQDGKHLVVLTKPDGTVGFNQSIEIGWMEAEKMTFSVMRAVAFLRQVRPIVQAFYEGNIDEVRRALAPALAAEAVQQRNYSGQQLVHRASMSGSSVSALRWALESRADPNAQNFIGATPLHHAAQEGCLAAMKVLLDAKADMDKADKDGVTPVYKAAEKNNKDCLDLLLRAKADMDKADNDGVTPVFFAAQENNKECLDLLLHAKANVDKATNKGATPVFKAAEKNNADCLKLLLHAKANVDKAMNDGATPVFIAAFKNSESCIKLLLHAKADMKKTWNGMSPLDMAKQQGNTACIKVLEDAEAGLGDQKE